MATLRNLMDNLAELDSLPSRTVKPVAARINEEIQRQFDQGSDPYGAPWPRLSPYTIAKKGHDLIMIQTGRLEAETKAYPMGGAGIEIVSVDYGGYHMEPFAGDADHPPRPARPVLPGRADLPIRWQNIIEEEFNKAFRKTMKR